MTDNARDGNDRQSDRSPNQEREQQQERDDLARRRELMRQAQLTDREREQRWPIG